MRTELLSGKALKCRLDQRIQKKIVLSGNVLEVRYLVADSRLCLTQACCGGKQKRYLLRIYAVFVRHELDRGCVQLQKFVTQLVECIHVSYEDAPCQKRDVLLFLITWLGSYPSIDICPPGLPQLFSVAKAIVEGGPAKFWEPLSAVRFDRSQKRCQNLVFPLQHDFSLSSSIAHGTVVQSAAGVQHPEQA